MRTIAIHGSVKMELFRKYPIFGIFCYEKEFYEFYNPNPYSEYKLAPLLPPFFTISKQFQIKGLNEELK